MAAVVQPYPFSLLPKIRRAQLNALRQVKGYLGATPAREAWARWVQRYLGGDNDDQNAPRVASVLPLDATELERRKRAAALAVGLAGPQGQRARLLLCSRLVSDLRAVLLRTQAVPLAGEPSEGERGLVLFLVAALLHELGPTCPWSVDSDPLPVADADEWVGLELEVSLAEQLGTAWLVLEPSLLARPVPPASKQERRRRHRGRLRRVLCVVPVIGGRVELPASELELLGEGDVMLWPGCPRGGRPIEGFLRAGEAEVPVVVDGETATVTGPLRAGGKAMSHGTGEQGAEEGLPVELVVELGRLRITAAELLELEAGDVLTLDRPLALTVDLRVGERLVGRAELVDVEGEAGIRLVEVFE